MVRVGVCMGKTTKTNAEILQKNKYIFALLQLKMCAYVCVKKGGEWACPPIHPEVRPAL